MKTGKSLTQLAQELDRQQNSKRDFIADTRELVLLPSAPTSQIQVNGHGMFHATDHTHGQIAQRIGIPKPYYDRMRGEAPQLLVDNVHHWFRNKPERRMIRTLDGNARAFLSDRYRPMDNYDMAQAVLPVLMDNATEIRIESCEITESRMYIKAVFPRVEGEIKKGDVVQSGIVVTNSEIGMGALKVEPLVYRLVCSNGLIAPHYGQRKAHLGRAADEGEAAFEMFRDETLAQDDKALWMKIQDVVRASMKSVEFEKIIESMRDATERQMTGSPVRAVEELSKRFQLNQSENDSILNQLIRGGDLSQYGLVNAITFAAQSVESYDRSTELERMGGNVLVLPARDWEVIAKAA